MLKEDNNTAYQNNLKYQHEINFSFLSFLWPALSWSTRLPLLLIHGDALPEAHATLDGPECLTSRRFR